MDDDDLNKDCVDSIPRICHCPRRLQRAIEACRYKVRERENRALISSKERERGIA